MSTSTSQRVGIWVIAVVLAVGTIGSFFVIIVANNNQAKDTKVAQDLQQQCQDDMQVAQEKLSSELSKKYLKTFSKFADQPSKFDATKVKDVSSKDLLAGTGEKISDSTDYYAYYIGWTPDGKVFDGSLNDGKLSVPISGKGLIPGWAEGVEGMKIGGVREITIPSDKAYGSKGSGSIPPNTPIKFVVMPIPSIDQDVNSIPDSCVQYYTQQQQ